jgi:hypothetical protein
MLLASRRICLHLFKHNSTFTVLPQINHESIRQSCKFHQSAHTHIHTHTHTQNIQVWEPQADFVSVKAHLQRIWKYDHVSSAVSVCPYVTVREQLKRLWLYTRVLLKIVDTFQILLKSDNSNWHITRRPICLLAIILNATFNLEGIRTLSNIRCRENCSV